ncbi:MULTISPECIES: DUF4266 domain-containing protein [Acinetobacter]|uniref:DUF4266 domain-containing protein n=1 Tax=Acinetobacter bereziniae NIPH 3 TaxID=1217651 RepID=N8XGX0_ACIBZ|nr:MULTISPECIES: DUF4266 domain-containing protein [Acinetobacter]MDA0697688.1 DUF4266 domain-containing protein [Pseudomonadota bacterium]ENV23782.1 hypothetical protein F963_00187 [Acinetobacter bereziniae NIPH 3]ENV52189.1 hypothetical protein F953_00362 [Acinetobacter junii CIP 107470 = MTCC 11364]MCM1958403.1 DUF4266 domain-containing protein [Acinetobacter modestus]MDA1255183.1 DUF4266 domain-containing protein [Pseudomonadota bacterium]
MKLSLKILTSLGILLPSLLLSACSHMPTKMQTLGVKPWERDILARPAMQLDAAPLDAAYDEHIYFSKEAASGGRGFGGGGCGCN